jgi:hypothetical protein
MNNSIILAITDNPHLIIKKEKHFKKYQNILFIYTGKSFSEENNLIGKKYYKNYEHVCETLFTRADVNKTSFEISKNISSFFIKNLFPNNYLDNNNFIIDGVIYKNIGTKIGKAMLFFEKYIKEIDPDLILIDKRCDTANLIGLIAINATYEVKYLNKKKHTKSNFLFIVYLFSRTVFEILIKPIISIFLKHKYMLYRKTDKNINCNKLAFFSFDINHFKTIFPLIKNINKGNNYKPVLFFPIMGKRIVPFGMGESKTENILVDLTDNYITTRILFSQIYFRIVSFSKIYKIRQRLGSNLYTDIIYNEISYLRFILTNIWIAYYYISLTNQIQSKHEFKLYIFGDDGSTYARAIILGLSKAYPKPKSIVMQHGIVADKYMYITHADYALLWGLQSKLLLEEFVNNKDRLIVYGSPRLENTINEYKLRKRENNIVNNFIIRNVLIALSPISVDNNKNSENIRLIINVVLGKYRNARVYVRFHPSQKNKSYLDILEKYKGDIFLDGETDVLKSIKKVDLVIAFASSVGIESMLLGKLTLFLYPFTGDWLMDVKEKLPLVADNIEELGYVINKLSNTQHFSDLISIQDEIIERLVCIYRKPRQDDVFAKIINSN